MLPIMSAVFGVIILNIDVNSDIWQYLAGADKPIVLYGMGNGADKIIDRLGSLGIGVAGVFASDEFVRHQQFRGFTVCSYADAKRTFGDMIVLVAFGTFRSDVIENIRRIGAEQELYAPDVPAYGSEYFTLSYYRENELRFERLYDRLADEQSKNVLRHTVLYKLTGKIEHLFACESTYDEANRNVLLLGNDELYLDIGAYNGDTVLQFADAVDSYRGVIAVEPDRKTYRKLALNTDGMRDVQIINAAVGDRVGEIRFSSKGGRNSSVGEGETVTSVTVDSICDGRDVTYIKIDVEGEEAAVISGATKTIADKHPKMLVSAYHRSGDIVDLFEQITNIHADYDVYMRHYRYIPCWDTNLYFVPRCVK